MTPGEHALQSLCQNCENLNATYSIVADRVLCENCRAKVLNELRAQKYQTRRDEQEIGLIGGPVQPPPVQLPPSFSPLYEPARTPTQSRRSASPLQHTPLFQRSRSEEAESKRTGKRLQSSPSKEAPAITSDPYLTPPRHGQYGTCEDCGHSGGFYGRTHGTLCQPCRKKRVHQARKLTREIFKELRGKIKQGRPPKSEGDEAEKGRQTRKKKSPWAESP